ncbi:MAG: hypothetical protein AB7Q17_02745 [Phycisphaerae bacterium]
MRTPAALSLAAISTLDQPKTSMLPPCAEAQAFLTAALGQKAQREEVSKRVFMTLRESDAVSLFETFDTKRKACIHVNCMAHETAAAPAETQQTERP